MTKNYEQHRRELLEAIARRDGVTLDAVRRRKNPNLGQGWADRYDPSEHGHETLEDLAEWCGRAWIYLWDLNSKHGWFDKPGPRIRKEKNLDD